MVLYKSITVDISWMYAGFLYMSDFLHQWLTATQYIAPLMANFDTTIGNHSLIHYADNGELTKYVSGKIAVSW